MGARGLIIGAPRSGSGKTTITLAIVCALRRRGLRVRVGKSGPDYIDPAFHAAASGAPCPNLDAWAMPPAQLDTIASGLAADADFVVIETAMGLFDGVDAPAGRSGAGAEVAARLGWPVVLVLDVSGQSQTAAAVALGLARYRADVRVAGVILNRVASERHWRQVAGAMAGAGLPVLGSVARDAAIALPERHLGLVQAEELGTLPALLERLAVLGARLDLDGLLDLAAEGRALACAGEGVLRPPGQRIALARDAAFSFVYPHMVAGWRDQGAEITTFSPLADETPPVGCDACWLPGGYPELHARQLAQADRFRTGLRQFADRGSVHGECGGYMVLGEGLVDAEGVRHRMAGLLGHTTSFARRKLHLGYRTARLLGDCALGRKGAAVRGHEFHYASVVERGPDAPLAEIADAGGVPLGADGGRRGAVSGSFFHALAGAP